MDRLLAQLSGGERPASPAPSDARPKRRIVRASSSRPSVAPVERIGLWARVALALILAAVITQWPYARACGWLLAAYLGAVAMVVVTGVWIAIVSWRLRTGAPHVLAFLVLLWGMMLAAERVLPRVGYAAQRAEWGCADEPTEAPPTGLATTQRASLMVAG